MADFAQTIATAYAVDGAALDPLCRSDSVQHLSAVHQRSLRLECVGEPV